MIVRVIALIFVQFYISRAKISISNFEDFKTWAQDFEQKIKVREYSHKDCEV